MKRTSANLSRAAALLLTFALMLALIPAQAAQAAVTDHTDTPVWKVAWITIPEVRVNVGVQHGEGADWFSIPDGTAWVTIPFDNARRILFEDSVQVFRDFIEANTNNAVKIEITYITINEVPEFYSKRDDCISFQPRITQEMIKKYNLEEYDTWMVGWPFHPARLVSLPGGLPTVGWKANHNIGLYNSANLTYDSREIYLEAECSAEIYKLVTIHEFLHTTEFWFRDTLGYPLPYNIAGGSEPWALHHPDYYGYGSVHNDVDNVDWNFLIDWLAQKVEDPKRPGIYLGIPAEAWQNTPSRISVTFEPNNGTEPVVSVVHTGAAVSKPANPSPTELTGDMSFRGWYLDKDCTQRAYFPYSVKGNVTFYAKWGDGGAGNYIVNSDNGEVYLDLGDERLYGAAEWGMAAYSADGGVKWTAGQPNLTTLLNKQTKLRLTDSFDTKKKKPAENANIITFPQIEKRPATNPDKLVINYAVCADSTGATAGAWTLAKKNANAASVDGIEIAHSNDKKNPDPRDGYLWDTIDENGISVLPYGTTKETFLARVAPVAEDGKYVPASKTWKLSPAVQGKATKLKADYKKEIIKLKAGTAIYGGTFEQLNANIPVATAASVFDTGLRYTAQAADSRDGIPLTAILDKTDKANSTTQTICIWTQATATKPATQVQQYKLAVRAVIAPQTLNGTNGRVTLPKTLEVFNNNRWGSMPKYTSAQIIQNAVRVKSTARATGVDDSSQVAASKAVALTVEYGVYTPADARTAKSGILSVGIGDVAEPEEDAA